MIAPARLPLDSRRELLVATIALQRFELRSHAGALRTPLRRWRMRASWVAGFFAMAAVGSWLVSLRGPAE